MFASNTPQSSGLSHPEPEAPTCQETAAFEAAAVRHRPDIQALCQLQDQRTTPASEYVRQHVLPFVSYGGTSMVSCMAMIGLIQGVASVNQDDMEYDYEISRSLRDQDDLPRADRF